MSTTWVVWPHGVPDRGARWPRSIPALCSPTGAVHRTVYVRSPVADLALGHRVGETARRWLVAHAADVQQLVAVYDVGGVEAFRAAASTLRVPYGG